jgi:hypothetical protein
VRLRDRKRALDFRRDRALFFSPKQFKLSCYIRERAKTAVFHQQIDKVLARRIQKIAAAFDQNRSDIFFIYPGVREQGTDLLLTGKIG